jgi:gamma-D-glutamyl-L-lysine dipeptidyl-peptidase
MISRIYDLIEEVRREFALDPRMTVLEVDVGHDSDGSLVLYGACSDPAAAEALHARIALLELDVPLRDELERIPESGSGALPHGLVVAATAPMLAGPLISHSHLSQVVLGERVLILREHGRWLHCRSQDGYLGWIHRGYLRRVAEDEARVWEIGGIMPLHHSLGAEVLDRDGQVLARLPWGARFGARGSDALLPDGRTGTLRGAALPFAQLPERYPPIGSAIVETACLWVGAPYLWGGRTPWGVDCSGLVQAVFRTHGIPLPRDSDQQAALGERIDPADMDGLQPGDLLYFAEQRDRISHVAISVGGSRIIHSAVGNGGVRGDDLAADQPYARELRSLLVAIRRVIPPAV